MSADVSTSPALDARPLHRLIAHTRRLLRSSWVLTGLGLTLGLFLTALVLTTLIDLVIPIWPTSPLEIPYWRGKSLAIPNLALIVRVTALVLVVVPAGWALLVGVVRPLFRRLSAERVARRIEAHLPGIHNRLVSCLDLENERRGPRSAVFYHRLLTEALERIKTFRPGMVLDFLSLKRAGLFALGGAAAFALLWVLFAASLPTALARVFFPMADIPRESGVKYTVLPASTEVLREEIIPFSAQVTTGTPDKLWLQVYGGKGSDPAPFDLTPDKRDPSLWKCAIDSVSLGEGFQNGFKYRILGGGTWSKEYEVKLLERPVLTGVKTYVHYPEYMKLPGRRETPPEASEVVGPEKGTVEVVVQARGQVSEGEVQLLKVGRRRVPVGEQTERIWFTDHPLRGNVEGTWERITHQKQPVHTEPVALGGHGHWFHDDPVGHAVQVGDVLFAHCFVVPGRAPSAILLQWHDGTSWDHGALWGPDWFAQEGKLKTPGKQPMGSVPAAGQWVRLEVPAALVGLEGKTLRGMAFKLYGGQCYWQHSGTLQVEREGYVADHRFPMTRDEEGNWAGRFPLAGTGHFRVELRKVELHKHKSYANTEMKEIRYVYVKDQPPQVVLEKPGSDSNLSKPDVLPLSIRADDDYGLDEISLLVWQNGTGTYYKQVLHRLDKPERNRSLVAHFKDVAKLKPGEQLRYAIEARDTKGQTTRTRQFVVKIADDVNAADKQLAAVEKRLDQFRERLLQLIPEQKKVQTAIEKASTRYAELANKLEAIQKDIEAGKVNTKIGPRVSQKEPDLASKMDLKTAKELMDLQKELAALAKEEDKNNKIAEQLNTDLAKAAEQAGQLQMLPRAIADQLQMTQQAFQQAALQSMRDLLGQMNQGANPRQALPDLKGIKQKSDRVEKELESLKERLDALARARKGLRDDLAEALKELQREMLNQTGGLTERDLKELRDYIAKLREDLKNLQQQQEDIIKNTAEGGDLKANEGKQLDLEKQMEKLLADARKLLEERKKRRPKPDDPEFPDSPYTPEGTEVKVPPKESDTNEPLPGQKDKKTDPMGNTVAGEKDKKEDEEPLFMPALGGPKPVVDKRFDKKQRPVSRKPGDNPMNPNDPEARRNNLQDRQGQRLQDLNAAQQALGSDQQSLDRMLDALQQAMKANQKGQQGHAGQQGQQGEDSALQQLMQMLQSPRMQQALAMAQRMRMPGQGQQGQPGQPQQGQSTTGNMDGGPVGNAAMQAELSKLDPNTRAVILKLQPHLREELLQGMREQGPEGYAAFIQDYFKRLTEAKGPNKP